MLHNQRVLTTMQSQFCQYVAAITDESPSSCSERDEMVITRGWAGSDHH